MANKTEPSQEMRARTFLGFDFGMRNIGVAVGQNITQTAKPLTTLQSEKGVPPWQEIYDIIKTWRPYALIVGIPLNMDGTEQDITHAAREFANELYDRYKILVFTEDERLTSVEARAQLFAAGGYKKLQKKTGAESIDSVAAQLILESWLRENSDLL